MSSNDATMDAIVTGIIDTGEIEIGPTTGKLGIKSSIGELITTENNHIIKRQLIQFYTECTVKSRPMDIRLGYTTDDILIHQGIVVAEVSDTSDPPSYIGEVLSIRSFSNRFDIRNNTKFAIIDLFQTLYDKSYPREEWLSKASSLYNDRIVGASWIANEMRVC